MSHPVPIYVRWEKMRGFTQIAFPPWVRTYPKNTSAKLTLYSDHRCGDELRVNVKYQELESSAKFLAIKRCQRTKIGKVISNHEARFISWCIYSPLALGVFESSTLLMGRRWHWLVKGSFADVLSCSCSLCEGVCGQAWFKVRVKILFGGGGVVGANGQDWAASAKEVLAKSVGDSASFLQYSGDSEVSFSKEVRHRCMAEFL